MSNTIKNKKKRSIFSNTNIVLSSLVLALWVNFFLLDSTNIWQSIKTSVINSNINEVKSDLSIINNNWELEIIINKNINAIDNLSFSLIYNPEIISIKDAISDLWTIITLSNTPWVSSIIFTPESIININKWDTIVKLQIEKSENISENLNILNANFKDVNWEQFLLSTSWITF